MNAGILQILHLVIQMKYPGGLERFLKEGGAIDASRDTLYVYHPNPPEELKKLLEGAPDEVNLKLVNTLNFEGVAPDQALSELKEVFDSQMTGSISYGVKASNVLISITMWGPGICAEKAQDIIEKVVRGVSGIVRMAVDYGTETLTYEKPENYESGCLVEERPARSQPITKDDLTNLKIVLEQAKDVDDIIKDL